MLWALVPVKPLAQSTQRLRECLGEHRPGLSLAMLGDLLEALVASREINRIAIVTADEQVRELARAHGVLLVEEPNPGRMNRAIGMGVEAIRAAGGTQVAIFPADLPLASGEEIDRVVRALRARQAVAEQRLVGICPAADRGGTNMLCVATEPAFPLRYGPGSYERHRQAALEAGCHAETLTSEAISLDIDTRADLDEFIARCARDAGCRRSRTWRFLLESGYVDPAGPRRRMKG